MPRWFWCGAAIGAWVGVVTWDVAFLVGGFRFVGLQDAIGLLVFGLFGGMAGGWVGVLWKELVQPILLEVFAPEGECGTPEERGIVHRSRP